jgi:hypothetical protein
MIRPSPSKNRQTNTTATSFTATAVAHTLFTFSLLLLLGYEYVSTASSFTSFRSQENDDSANQPASTNQRNRALNILHTYSTSLGMFHPNITQPFSPASHDWDVELEWAALQSTTIFRSGTDGSVQKKLTKKQTKAFKAAKLLALQHVQQQHLDPSKKFVVTGSWVSLNAWDRKDFLIMLLESSSTTKSSKLVHIPYRGGHFFDILPQNSNIIPTTPIAVLTSFACRLETLENFLDITIGALEQVQGQKRAVLVVAECVQTTTVAHGRDPVSKWRVESMIKQYKKKHGKVRSHTSQPVEFNVIFLNRPFSRPLALNRAADALKHDEIAVVLDVDMRVSSSFFVHCRTFSRPGQSAYFPFPFVRNQPLEDTNLKTKISIRKQFGRWDTSSHNTFAIASSDLSGIGMVGSFNPRGLNWGTEDNDLMRAVVGTGLRVMRMFDPTLAHHYHKTDCGSVTGHMCLGSSKLLGSGVKLISHWDV